MSFPRYPKYKASGVEWLGEVPQHWSLTRLGFLCEKIGSGKTPSGGSETYANEGVVFIRSQNVYDEGLFLDDVVYITAETDEEMAGSRVRDGDVLLNITGASLGRTCLVPSGFAGGNVNQHVCIIRLIDRTLRQFVAMFLKSIGMKAQIDAAQTGAARDGLNFAQISKLALTLPPITEQTKIASFLDRETSKIDGLVGEQRRLMELLKEKRQAVISHAVTKGLNPHAPLKPSGIEWLGDVPEHWEVRRVKTVSSFITSGPRGWSERIGEAGSLFVQSGDLNDRLEVEFATAKRVQVDDDAESTRTRLFDGDVVVCVTGAKTGNVAVCATIPEAAYVNQHLCLVRPTSDVLPLFLGVLLKSRLGQTYFEVSQYGLKQGLSLEDVKEAPVLLPSVDEQRRIIAFIDTETMKIDTLTAEAERGIELLQERRTALISAAVTGKIDVRGLAETEDV